MRSQYKRKKNASIDSYIQSFNSLLVLSQVSYWNCAQAAGWNRLQTDVLLLLLFLSVSFHLTF
jgi:hypothetical protein